MKKNINIQNKKAKFEYELLEKYNAGIKLLGLEIKSIRNNKVIIKDSFCQIKNGEIYIINMHISNYDKSNYKKYNPKRERKLLLNKKEIFKLDKKIKKQKLTIIPMKLFINNNNYAKIQIFLAKGRKIYDKREYIQKRDLKRDKRNNL